MAPLPFLLLFLLLPLLPLLPTTHAKPLVYQTLYVGNLSFPLLPDTLDVDLFEETQLSSSLHLPLLHVDSLLAPLLHKATHTTTKTKTQHFQLTPQSLLHFRLLRDASHFASLCSRLPNSTHHHHHHNRPRHHRQRRRRQPTSFNSTVISGLSRGSGEYFTRVGIGTPPTPSLLVLDTGSDVVWSQCSPCSRCYPQSLPIFEPRNSSTFRPLPCYSGLCRLLDDPSCQPHRRSCLYRVSYGDGSSTSGDFSTDTFSFRRRSRLARVAFGCGHDNEGLFVAASGLLGLGRGPLSFSSQLSRRRFGRRFSYCLVDRTSPALSRRRRSSTLVFGASALPTSPSAVYTPMVRNPKLDTFYYVEMTGASVGGARVRGIRPTDLRLDRSTGRGGVIVDSGTSVTRLARPSYAALRNAFRRGTTGLPRARGFSLFDTCYDLRGRTEVEVPTVAFHFLGTRGGSGEVTVSLPPGNYLIPVDTDGIFCFAFAGTESGISIIGNIQQQGFRVAFDGERARVGFVPKSC